MKTFLISVDVEEDLPGVLRPGTIGIDRGLPVFLEMLSDLRVPADFFFLSTIVRTRPDLVREIKRRGHAIGNHGLDHRFLCTKARAAQRREIRESTRLLTEVLGGVAPVMFRAPGFSVNQTTLTLLDECRYSVDSSVLPGRYMRRFGIFKVYDHRGAPEAPYHPTVDGGSRRLGLVEVPVTVNPLRVGAPVGLGALNYYGEEKLLRVIRASGLSMILFLVHPWELIDASSAYPSLPKGYAKACSGDLAPLRRFLFSINEEMTISSLSEVAEIPSK